MIHYKLKSTLQNDRNIDYEVGENLSYEKNIFYESLFMIDAHKYVF